jgi:hypothetical protein
MMRTFDKKMGENMREKPLSDKISDNMLSYLNNQPDMLTGTSIIDLYTS